MVKLKHFWKHQHLCRYQTFFFLDSGIHVCTLNMGSAALRTINVSKVLYRAVYLLYTVYEVTKPTGSYPSLSMQYKKLLLSEAFVTILFLQPSLCPEGEHTVKMAPRCFYLFFIRRLYLLPHSISIFLAVFFSKFK